MAENKPHFHRVKIWNDNECVPLARDTHVSIDGIEIKGLRSFIVEGGIESGVTEFTFKVVAILDVNIPVEVELQEDSLWQQDEQY